jgi:hypothetical protein
LVPDSREIESTVEALFSALQVEEMLARIDSVESASYWPRVWASKQLIIMTASTLLSLLRRDLISLEQVHSLFFKSILEGGALIDPAHDYRKIMSDYYTPLTMTESCFKPLIMGFGVGYSAYSELIGSRPNISFSKICEVLMGLGKSFHSTLSLVDVDGSGVHIGLDRFFSLPNGTFFDYQFASSLMVSTHCLESIIEVGDSNQLLSTETKCTKVFDFALQACFKILQFKINGSHEDRTDFQWLLARFEDLKNGGSRDENEIVEIQTSLEKLQDCLSLLAAVGPFAAAMDCAKLLFELDQAYTLHQLSSDMNSKMWTALQIRESEVTPQDFSPKTMALFEFLDTFLSRSKQKLRQDESGGREKKCFVLVEDGRIAYSLYKLLNAVSSVFPHSKPCIVGHLDELSNFRADVYNTLILTDFDNERDYSCLYVTLKSHFFLFLSLIMPNPSLQHF